MVPSARFRIRQHFPLLRARGVEIEDHCPSLGGGRFLPGLFGRVRGRYVAPVRGAELLVLLAQRVPGILASHRVDLTWLERNFVPLLDDASVLLKRPVVIDIDDAIWLYNPFGRSTVRRLIRRADAVIAGNSFLADWCSSACPTVYVVPTAIDAVRFCPVPADAVRDRPFTLGWTGTSTNFRFLESIAPTIGRFLEDVAGSRLLVMADKAPALPAIPPRRWLFREWTPETEHHLAQQMDVGIMPVDDSDIVRGKCSFKMLQYMACGLPVIVSPVGMNAEVLGRGALGFAARESDEWLAALHAYHDDPALRARHGGVGREVVLREYDLPVVGEQIAEILTAFG